MNIRTKILALLIVLSMFVGSTTACVSEHKQNNTTPFVTKQIQMNIEFRPNVTSLIDITLHENPKLKHVTKGKVGYALAGFAHNGASYEHLITQIFSENKDVSMIIVPEIPGSNMPKGMLYGDLVLNDYVNINKLVLDRLSEGELRHNFKIDFAVFHSQAGLVAMMLQEQVNLKKYGIKDVILIAPAPPQEVKWSFASNMNPYSFLQYLTIDNNGAYFNLPSRDWIGFFFTNPDGSISRRLPSMENVDKYNTKAPLSATLQLVGINILSMNPPTLELNNSIRPSVTKGIFRKNSPKLWIIDYGNDTIVSKNDVINTYNYLMDTKENINKVEIMRHRQHSGIIYVPNAVHDAHLVMNIEEINRII